MKFYREQINIQFAYRLDKQKKGYDFLSRTLLAALDVEGMELELVRDVGVVLLALEAVLVENAPFQNNGRRCPIVRHQRICE